MEAVQDAEPGLVPDTDVPEDEGPFAWYVAWPEPASTAEPFDPTFSRLVNDAGDIADRP